MNSEDVKQRLKKNDAKVEKKSNNGDFLLRSKRQYNINRNTLNKFK